MSKGCIVSAARLSTHALFCSGGLWWTDAGRLLFKRRAAATSAAQRRLHIIGFDGKTITSVNPDLFQASALQAFANLLCPLLPLTHISSNQLALTLADLAEIGDGFFASKFDHARVQHPKLTLKRIALREHERLCPH